MSSKQNQYHAAYLLCRLHFTAKGLLLIPYSYIQHFRGLSSHYSLQNHVPRPVYQGGLLFFFGPLACRVPVWDSNSRTPLPPTLHKPLPLPSKTLYPWWGSRVELNKGQGRSAVTPGLPLPITRPHACGLLHHRSADEALRGS